MPVLSRFHGIVVKMYFLQGEHNPPHVHAIYGEDMVAIAIHTGEALGGALPPRAMALLDTWIALYREELVMVWETQKFKALPPLD